MGEANKSIESTCSSRNGKMLKLAHFYVVTRKLVDIFLKIYAGREFFKGLIY